MSSPHAKFMTISKIKKGALLILIPLKLALHREASIDVRLVSERNCTNPCLQTADKSQFSGVLHNLLVSAVTVMLNFNRPLRLKKLDLENFPLPLWGDGERAQLEEEGKPPKICNEGTRMA